MEIFLLTVFFLAVFGGLAACSMVLVFALRKENKRDSKKKRRK